MSAVELDERLVPDGAPAERLDKVVARLFGVSRSRAMEWIAEGRVRVDGKRAPKGSPVQAGARISVERPPPDQPAPQSSLDGWRLVDCGLVSLAEDDVAFAASTTVGICGQDRPVQEGLAQEEAEEISGLVAVPVDERSRATAPPAAER